MTHVAIRSWNAARALVLLGLGIVVGGCAALNPFAGGGGEGEPAPLMDFEPEARIVYDWRVGVGGSLGERFNEILPAADDLAVYAADAYGRVVAYSREDGEQIWRARVGTPRRDALSWVPMLGRDDDGGSFLTGGVGLGQGHVVVGTTRGEVIALNAADGSERWRAQVSSEVLVPPAVAGDVVVVQTADGRLSGLALEDGSALWHYDTQVPVLTLRGDAPPIARPPVVLAGFASGKAAVLSLADGNIVWEHRTALPEGRSELERMRDVDGAGVLANNAAFVASYQGAVKALRPADGAVLWEYQLSVHRDLATGYGQLYAVDENDVLYAFDQSSGDVLWRQDGLRRRSVTGAAVIGPYLAVADADGYVHVFAQSDGRPIARERFDRSGIRSRPVADGDRLLVLGNSGRLGALRVERLEE